MYAHKDDTPNNRNVNLPFNIDPFLVPKKCSKILMTKCTVKFFSFSNINE